MPVSSWKSRDRFEGVEWWSGHVCDLSPLNFYSEQWHPIRLHSRFPPRTGCVGHGLDWAEGVGGRRPGIYMGVSV